MSAVCPEGHRSESTDYCDTCGSPIGGQADAGMGQLPSGGFAPSGWPGLSGSAGQAAEPEPAAEPLSCPHCGGLNVQDALFCEECGYDFTTGTPPMGSTPAAEAEVEPELEMEPEVEPEQGAVAGTDEVTADEAGPEPEEPVGGEPDVSPEPDEGDEPDRVDEPDGGEEPEVVAEPAEDEPAAGEPKTEAPEVEAPEVDEPEVHEQQVEATSEPEPEAAPEPAPSPEPEPAPEQARRSTRGKPRHTPPSRALSRTWVVELWVDPDWYAVQQTEEQCPSAGVPDIVQLTRSSALIGRPSGNLGVRPEVDAGTDSAVSRRHAQLTSDGQRWWIEDLGSSNGTFVGTVGDPLPTTPLTPGQRIELDRDDRVYVGAWTRIALRPATESETQGQG